ncbi:conserved hypothetical protein [Theileria orientalis strain Shintoku]|uniref:A-kinase anchor protein 7-like phosphoesterase domain-containing protein n=1 Tax=Theileria orientalis strain Shintoku TaxID=869250 RepID=J7MBT0_THEOR|nr:conserved hypothetical protein [Theileria orientalis strain Shintoku]PVC54722.1 hypothetical protein MACL_00000704 [Theileria orientalis]BAM38567.1 conserved hypothetical protein [Theileria orientalis strain Shintoku]|eukprot:XP_009688868.1 conserved hypothetical protein [Theileria orientalis strain Shintoku]
MNRFDSSEFQFENKLIKVPKLKRNTSCTFRIPKPNGICNTNIACYLDPAHSNTGDAALAENQHSVNVRSPFKNLIERNIEHVEKLYEVRMSLQEVDDDYKLIASGVKAEQSINEILNICRKSNVYNFYLCFPVRGEAFHKKFSEFKKDVLYKLGGNASFEKRPHITLSLVNLVTDSDVELVVRALQSTSIAIKSVPKSQRDPDLEEYSIDLEGLDVVKYKGKYAKRSVLMSNVTLSETLADIATEFQSTLNKSVNTLISSHQKRKKISRSDRISNLTESQLAPKGIFLTRGGNIEITFTDVPLVDPKACASGEGEGDQEGAESMLDVHKSNNKGRPEDFNHGEPSNEGLLSREDGVGREGRLGNDRTEPWGNGSLRTDGRAEERSAQKEGAGEGTENNEHHGDSEDDEVYEFDTAVKNKLHVTLMRHQQVGLLSNMKFASKGHVVCAELRPRNGETCSFTAYNSNELASFVGNRFDNKEHEDVATSQIPGSQPPKLPTHYLVDAETEKMDEKEERFVFWI